MAAANDGFKKLRDPSLADRAKAVACVYRLCDEQAAELGRLELEETKIGRLDHKIEKLQIVKLVPGIEFLKCDATSGDHGLTVTEYAPFGVIGAITPVTHSLPTLAGNVVSMVSSGNTVVFNPHPAGRGSPAKAFAASTGRSTRRPDWKICSPSSKSRRSKRLARSSSIVASGCWS